MKCHSFEVGSRAADVRVWCHTAHRRAEDGLLGAFNETSQALNRLLKASRQMVGLLPIIGDQLATLWHRAAT